MSPMPNDRYNAKLMSNVSPHAWRNPKPARFYNLVVIGAGTAGLVSAAAAAGLGARVALIERHMLGGDCLNVGCVPSKALISSARAARQLQQMRDYGLTARGEVDFGKVMERLRRLRSEISSHDAVGRFSGELGIDVFLGEGAFEDPGTVVVDGQRLRYRRAVIATGARPQVPAIEGLAAAGFRTNETIFDLTERPARLLVIGGGPLGCELAQAFARLGSKVTIVQSHAQFLPREDPQAASILAEALSRDGVEMLFSCQTRSVRRSEQGKLVSVQHDGQERVVAVDEILVAAGRRPNLEGLNLEAAGVLYDQHGVKVDDFLRTANKRVYAAGDICLPYKFTHTADEAARIVIANALFGARRRVSRLTVPWCTYTDPEVAHVGLYAHEARTRGIDIETIRVEMADVDRAVLDGEPTGFVKVIVKKGSDRILGATIVAPQAGKLISELSLAMVGGLGLKTIANVIHPYPTQAESVRKVADSFNRKRLTPRVQVVLKNYFRLLRI